jgi:dienelactone hydrolase
VSFRPAALLAAGALAAGCAAGSGSPSPPAMTGALPDRDGVIEFLSGQVRLGGRLSLPDGPGPFPAMILMHGCAGVGRAERGWSGALVSWGYAAFVVDSFGGRGLREVCTQARTLVGTQRVPDAYGALAALGRHPRIDAARIGLMGFSHGGGTTLGAATVRARQVYLGGGHPGFRGFWPFYPGCNVEYPELTQLSAPMRIHIGAADDWTRAIPCQTLAASLRAGDQDVAITVYPGAQHSFDSMGRAVTRLPNVDNGSACHWRLATMNGPTLNPAEILGCRSKGATIGYSAESTKAARERVRSELAAILQ